jgi:hypothetical protein
MFYVHIYYEQGQIKYGPYNTPETLHNFLDSLPYDENLIVMEAVKEETSPIVFGTVE